MQSYRDRKYISSYPGQKVREGNDCKQIKHNFGVMEVLGVIKLDCGDFPGSPVAKNPVQRTQAQPLVRELRSHIPQSKQAHEPQLEKTTFHNKDPAQPKLKI